MKNIKIYNTDAAYLANAATLPKHHVAYSKDNMTLHFGGIKKVVDYITEEEYGSAVFDVFRAQGWIASDANVMTLKEAAAITDLGLAFVNNTSITDVTFLRYFTGLTRLTSYENGRNNGFMGSPNIVKACIPVNVTGTSFDLFRQNTVLQYVEVLEGVTNLAIIASDGSSSGVTVILPSTLETIGNNCFKNCGNEVFDLRHTSLSSIGNSFCSAGKSTVVLFPPTLESIGNNFMYWGVKSNIVFYSTTVPTIGTSFCENKKTSTQIFVPEGCISDYEAVANLSNFVGRIYEIGGTEWAAAGLDQYE